MNRFQAFLTHLGISIAVLAVILYFVFFWWYPDFFFTSDGGGQGLRIVLLVDLVLGPVLTFVVFNPAKPELKRDLTIIGTLQAVCLAAGVFVVWSERPLALAYSDGAFYSVSRDEYREPPKLDQLPGPYPKRVYVEVPSDVFEQSQLRSEAWRSGYPLRTLPERYRPWKEMPEMFAEAISTEAILAEAIANGDPNNGLARWKAEYGELEGFGFFPFGARYGVHYLGVSRESGEIVGMLDWPGLVEEQ